LAHSQQVVLILTTLLLSLTAHAVDIARMIDAIENDRSTFTGYIEAKNTPSFSGSNKTYENYLVDTAAFQRTIHSTGSMKGMTVLVDRGVLYLHRKNWLFGGHYVRLTINDFLTQYEEYYADKESTALVNFGVNTIITDFYDAVDGYNLKNSANIDHMDQACVQNNYQISYEAQEDGFEILSEYELVTCDLGIPRSWLFLTELGLESKYQGLPFKFKITTKKTKTNVSDSSSKSKEKNNAFIGFLKKVEKTTENFTLIGNTESLYEVTSIGPLPELTLSENAIKDFLKDYKQHDSIESFANAFLETARPRKSSSHDFFD